MKTSRLTKLLVELADADEMQGVDGSQQKNTDGVGPSSRLRSSSPERARVNALNVLDGASSGATTQFTAPVGLYKKSTKKFNLGSYVLGLMMFGSFFIYFLKVLTALDHTLAFNTYISLPIIMITAIYFLLFIHFSGRPKSYFGFTTKSWRQSIATMNKIALPMIILILLLKWSCIHYLPFAHGELLFTLFHKPHVSVTSWLFDWVIYVAISAPLQAIFVYGGLQGPFMELVAPHNNRNILYLPVAAASLFFSVFHLFISVPLAIVAGIFSFICGLVYSYHGTLVGQIYMHILIGTWFFFIVGFPVYG